MSVNIYDKDTDTLKQVAGNAILPIDDTVSSSDKTYSSSKIENDYMKTYTNLKDIGIASKTTSVSSIFNIMPDNSKVVIGCGHSTSSTIANDYDVTDIPMYTRPSIYGVLEVIKINTGRHSIKFSPSLSGNVAPYKVSFGRIKGTDGSSLTWDEVVTKTKPKFSGIKTKTMPSNTLTNFGATVTIDKTSQYQVGFTVVSKTEITADTNMYYDICVYDVTDSKKVPYFENSCLGWKHNPLKSYFCEKNNFICDLTDGHTYDVRMYTNVAIDYNGELWVKEV